MIAVTTAGRKYIRIFILCKIQRREIKIWDSLGDLIAKLTAIVEDSMELSVVNKVLFALFTVATLTGRCATEGVLFESTQKTGTW